MTRVYDAAVAGCVFYTCWRGACALIEAEVRLRRAPWPVRRSTPEPVRLRLVRGGRVYDWQSDELVSASGGSRTLAPDSERKHG